MKASILCLLNTLMGCVIGKNEICGSITSVVVWTYLLSTPPSNEALRHSGGDNLLWTSATVTLYFEVELSKDNLPGTEQKMSTGEVANKRPSFTLGSRARTPETKIFLRWLLLFFTWTDYRRILSIICLGFTLCLVFLLSKSNKIDVTVAAALLKHIKSMAPRRARYCTHFQLHSTFRWKGFDNCIWLWIVGFRTLDWIQQWLLHLLTY